MLATESHRFDNGTMDLGALLVRNHMTYFVSSHLLHPALARITDQDLDNHARYVFGNIKANNQNMVSYCISTLYHNSVYGRKRDHDFAQQAQCVFI